MSTIIVHSPVPIETRLASGARGILTRDLARAQKLLAGLHAHGPLVFQEARAARSSDNPPAATVPSTTPPTAIVTSDTPPVATVPSTTPPAATVPSTTPPAATVPSTTSPAATVPSTTPPAATVPSTTPPAATVPSDTHPHGHGVNHIGVTDSGVTYTMSVGIGQPPTQYTLLVDTGSSNTWVGASTQYNSTSTCTNTGKPVSVSYGSGSFAGTEYTDTVTLSPSLVIKNQSIAVASTVQGFYDIDGILGIGPVDLTEGTVSGASMIPTVTDNLIAQGDINVETIGISFVPTTSSGVINGELTFGETDSTKYTGNINYVPITSKAPASRYWGIDQTVTYGANTPLLTSSGIVDTGTTLLLLATDAFQVYQQATGAVLDQTTGLLTVTQQQYDKLQSLFFKIGEVTYELTANAQIWPRSSNTLLGGSPDSIYLITSDLGRTSGSGLDFINGFAFLQRFYSEYDTTNSRVGLATTPYTNATTN